MTIKRGDFKYDETTREHRREITIEKHEGFEEFPSIAPLNLRKSEPEQMISLDEPAPLRKSMPDLVIEPAVEQPRFEHGDLRIDSRANRQPLDDNG